MRQWANTLLESSTLYSPIGLRLIDDLTGGSPLGTVVATLDITDLSGGWRETDVHAVNTPSAIVTYPGLEYHGDVTGLPARQYRVRLISDLYIPYYQINADGIVFTAYPYNDSNPPAVVTQSATDIPLFPAPNYPFASHIPVLRGVVVDAGNQRVTYAYVTQAHTERAVTDGHGNFALPLRWVAPNTATPIDATDPRTGRSGTISIQLPAALNSSLTISIH